MLKEDEYISIGNDGEQVLDIIVTEFSTEAKLNSLNTQILVGYNLFDNFNILVGNRLGYVTSTNLNSQLVLISPEDAQFKNDGTLPLDETGRIITIENGEIHNKNSIESALIFGINYDLNLPFIDDKLSLNTELMNSYNYISVVNNSSWTINSIYLNLGFKYQI